MSEIPSHGEHEREIDQKRVGFYRRLAQDIPPNSRIYYPGAGTDILPVSTLKMPIIYGDIAYEGILDHPTNIYSKLKNSSKHHEIPRAYRHFEYVGQFDPGHIVNVVDDMTRSSFPDSSFDLLITKNIVADVLKDVRLVPEMDRILKRGGILIYEWGKNFYFPSAAEWSRELLQDVFDQFVRLGYQSHFLDPHTQNGDEDAIFSQLVMEGNVRPGRAYEARDYARQMANARIRERAAQEIQSEDYMIRVLTKK